MEILEKTKVDVKLTIEKDLKEKLEKYAKATGQKQSDVVSQALNLIFNPVPLLVSARKITEDNRNMIRSIYDHLHILLRNEMHKGE